MVSRAGRSKGCSNCRKRRIKCDETWPVCNRCKKCRLACDGPKESTWINRYGQPSNGTTIVLHGSVLGELSFVAFEDDICVAYTRKHLMKGGCIEVACDIIQRVGLSDSALEPGLDLLRNAILSLSASFYGDQHGQKNITNRGYQSYGKVLRKLNAHLAQPHLQTTDETILTTVTCMILEIFVPTGQNNFFQHVRGIEAIIAERGPPTSPTGVSPAMISGVRILCIIGALVHRRPTIWATDEWKNIPPPHTDEGSVLRHEILLVLAECTVVTEELKPPSSEATTSKGRYRTLASAHDCLNKLEAIYSRWKRYNESMFDKEMSSATTDPNFANHASATTYMLYKAALIFILRIMHALSPSKDNSSLQVAASLRIIECLELKGHEKREGSGESNTIAFVATKVAWETLGGFGSAAGRRLARAVKAAAKGLFAVGAWDEPKELTTEPTVPVSLRDISTVTPQVPWASSYRAVELIKVGEKPPIMEQ
ncbi:hypothetical protein BU23DRAFT_595224 [Bimuria novae-zelandiae CBS 107.79]|uniref:Zn(2)-C6 fungal-type domain-containing protein n=1 Tax=Bimuria novae-zelandiae CBS 107.79 TaxID=1447943 RepID=A0A6A5VUC5_9PLEO|nr:hypothetical protein BU23DRAFT_595224 [Bimuria novae-zelandiae CBS 107.79]